MAVVTAKSSMITNRDATPQAQTNSGIARARLHRSIGVVAIANGDSVGSKYLALSIPSSAIVSSLNISAPDIGTTTAADVGLYKSTFEGGAVVDADFFKAAVVLNAGAITKSEVLFGNVVTVANAEKRLWEHLGLSADPQIMYDIVLTLTGAADAAGSVCAEALYCE
jgi:hypothetical protein